MKIRIKFIIFFLIFLLMYISLNSFVILRLGELLGVDQNVLYLLIALATVSLPVALGIERKFPTIVSKFFYTIATLWMGILFFLFCGLLLYEVIKPFYTIPNAGIIIIIIVTALSILSVINAANVVVKEVTVPLENLKKDVTIVQLSDIHVGTIRNAGFLKRIVEKTNQLDPDIVMITGDMVDNSSRLHKGIFNDFNSLRAQIYFVTGNHEIYEEKERIYEFLTHTKIRTLRNELVLSESIQIIGVEFSEDKSHLEKVLERLKIDKEKPAVLICHAPEGIEAAKRAGINLQLAGHTHAGQIVPFNFFVRIQFKHIKGFYDLGGMFLHVSPGTGTWGPYMRLGSRNEITLLKLKAPRQ